MSAISALLLLAHLLIIQFKSTGCVVPESTRYGFPEVSTEEQARFTVYNRPMIRSSDDLERMFRDSGIPIVIQREILNKEFTMRNEPENMPPVSDEVSSGIDPWSIVWYIGSFGGLIAFFLVVSCSEWCCARNRNSNRNDRRGPVGRCQQQQQQQQQQVAAGTPPPAYHLFAPPSYDTCSLDSEKKSNGFDVYVVPVHTVEVQFTERRNTVEQLPPPPTYTAVDIPS